MSGLARRTSRSRCDGASVTGRNRLADARPTGWSAALADRSAFGRALMTAGRGPAGEEPERIVRGAAGLCGISAEGESLVGFQGHGFEHQVQAPDLQDGESA